MIEFQGTYFDGKNSMPYTVKVKCDGRVLRIQGKDLSFEREFTLSDCRIDPPLGRTAQTIHLPGGAVCETENTNALSAVNAIAEKNRGMRFVHFIESRWKLVILSLAGLILFIGMFKVYAIPYFAKEIAYALPASVTKELSHQTMKILDNNFLKPSTLGTKKINQLRGAFLELLKDMDSDDFDYRLEFRRSPLLGANAFALPSGQIVMTDELVKLSKNERELEGILLHEIGHVQERHGLRMAIQSAGLFLIIAALLGDFTEISSTAASLPVILVQSEYSREFERAADQFAALYFVRKEWDIKPLQNILQRIAENIPNFPGESVFSTHPVMKERIQYLEKITEKQKSVKNRSK